MTDMSDRTTLVTLYQAGEGIYELMDKVLLIDEGQMIYQGPANEAKGYFIDLGFDCPERETTADFLTGITDPAQRVYREGFEAKVPKTAEELEKAFRRSASYKRVLADVQAYEKEIGNVDYTNTQEFKQSVKEQKSKTVSRKSNFTVSFWSQVVVSERWFGFGHNSSDNFPRHVLNESSGFYGEINQVFIPNSSSSFLMDLSSDRYVS